MSPYYLVRKNVLNRDSWETCVIGSYDYSDTELGAYIKTKDILLDKIKSLVDATKEVDIKIQELSK